MGRLNIIRANIADTLVRLENLRGKTDPKDSSSNKEEYDRLHKRLNYYRTQLAALGMESSIVRVTLVDRFMYLTGVTVIEAKELLEGKFHLPYVKIESITPGILLRKP